MYLCDVLVKMHFKSVVHRKTVLQYRVNRFRDIDVGSRPKKRPKKHDRFLPTLYVPLYHVGNKKPDNVDRDYIVLLSNLIEEGNVQCIVEQLDLATGNTAGQDGDTLAMR